MEGYVSPDELNLAQVPRLLDEGKAVVLKQIYGNSMLPFIRGGVDSVRLRKPEGVKVGDIVLAVFGGRPIVHRVIAIDGTKVTLMGDGNPKGMKERKRVTSRRCWASLTKSFLLRVVAASQVTARFGAVCFL